MIKTNRVFERKKPKTVEQVDGLHLKFKESVFVERPDSATLAKWFNELNQLASFDGTDTERLMAYYFDCGFCIGRGINPRECYFDEDGKPFDSLGTSTLEGLADGISIIKKGLLCPSFGNSVEFEEKYKKAIVFPLSPDLRQAMEE